MAVCSMLCTDDLLLHSVGKGQLLVDSGASYGNGKLGDSIWESHHKSSVHTQTLPLRPQRLVTICCRLSAIRANRHRLTINRRH